MRRIVMTTAILLTTMAAVAQTLNVVTGDVTTQYAATQTGVMTYTGGTQLTILNKTYQLSGITKMYTDETEIEDNTVSVVYNGTSAKVVVAGNIARYVDVTVNGAHVSIAQSNELTNDLINAGEASEITYALSGSSTNGEFAMSGSAKATVELRGVVLTNPTGAAINITNGKRIAVSAKKGTENTLKDGVDGSQKAALYCKGHLELKGKGTLTVKGNTAHAIKSGDYTSVKNLTLNITGAVKDGISCNEFFLMESGTVTISGVGDDGIQCDIDNDEGVSTGELKDHEDEDSGNIYLEGGTLSIEVTADATKGVKSEGDMKISGGEVTISTSGGGVWDTSKLKTKAAACLGADGNMTVSGGTLTLTSTGAGGKGINVDGNFTATGGTIVISTSGNAVVASSSGVLSEVTNSQQLDRYASDYKSSPKGIKVDGTILIADKAVINVTTTGAGGEGIESKTSITITGGQTTVNASDDAINASYNTDTNGTGNLTIEGGYVYVHSSGNDGLDANGNCYIKGGLVYAIGSGGAEKSIDANTEQGKKLYITGGTIIAVGDLENGSSISGGTCKYTTSWTTGTWYALYNGSTLVAAFKTPNVQSTGNPFGGPGGPGGNTQQKLIVYTSSTPSLMSGIQVSGGTEYFGGNAKVGGSVSGGSTVALSNYSSSSGRW